MYSIINYMQNWRFLYVDIEVLMIFQRPYLSHSREARAESIMRTSMPTKGIGHKIQDKYNQIVINTFM